MKNTIMPKTLPRWVFGLTWYKVKPETLKSDSGGSGGKKREREDLAPSNPIEGNLISSLIPEIDFTAPDGTKEKAHYPILDLDIPVHLSPSSTPGHSHLFIPVPLGETQMGKLIDVLVECGILQSGIRDNQWLPNKQLTLRPPWVKKGEEKSLAEQSE